MSILIFTKMLLDTTFCLGVKSLFAEIFYLNRPCLGFRSNAHSQHKSWELSSSIIHQSDGTLLLSSTKVTIKYRVTPLSTANHAVLYYLRIFLEINCLIGIIFVHDVGGANCEIMLECDYFLCMSLLYSIIHET